jgi:hypothetical protein
LTGVEDFQEILLSRFASFQVEMKAAIIESNTMKAFTTLNPWAQGPGSARSERHDMVAELALYYGEKKCMVVPSTKVKNVIGAHIWPLHAFPGRMVELGLHHAAVHHARNGLFLTCGIEKAFDKLQVTFLLDKEGGFRLRVLDNKLAQVSFINYSGNQDKSKWGSSVSTTNFKAIDGDELVFPANKPPYRRLLWLHAHWALRHMLTMQWEPIDPLAVQAEGDLSTMRKLSETNPFSKIEKDLSLELAFPWIQSLSASSEASMSPSLSTTTSAASSPSSKIKVASSTQNKRRSQAGKGKAKKIGKNMSMQPPDLERDKK